MKASSAQQPEQRMGSGRGDEHGAGTGARGGRVAGGKRKATAAGAWEAVRAEKVRREVHWAHVRAAMCAVLHRARRRERGKGQQRKKRTGHTPGTTTIVANEAVVNAEASVVREAKTENRPKRKCKDIPPGTPASNNCMHRVTNVTYCAEGGPHTTTRAPRRRRPPKAADTRAQLFS